MDTDRFRWPFRYEPTRKPLFVLLVPFFVVWRGIIGFFDGIIEGVIGVFEDWPEL